MKKKLFHPLKVFALFIAICCTSLVHAQTTFQLIPNLNLVSNSAGYAPCGDQRWTRTCFLVSPAEMAASGILNGQILNFLNIHQFNVANPPASGTVNVYLQNTTNTTYLKGTTWSTAIAGMINVTNAPLTLPTTAGVYYPINFNLSTFTYSGSGLYVAIEWSNVAGPLSTATGASVNNATTGMAARTQTTSATAPATLANTSFRPELQMGFVYTNDVAVTNIYTLGKIPIQYGSPTIIQANIKNAGTLPMTNINVAMNVTGTNSFTDNQVIATLAGGASTTVSFASYTPANLSTGDVVTVAISAVGDQNPANDIKTWSQDVTQNVYTYKNPAQANAGGVGFNGATGDFVAKFNSHAGATAPYNNPPKINEIKVDLFATATPAQTYQVGIWDATGAGGTPGANIWTSPVLNQVAGTAFIPVPDVPVSGDYFVGVRQTGTVNVSFGYQTENPIRSGTFYYTSPTGGTTWTDFNAASAAFRFSIEVTVHIPVPPNCAINFSPTSGGAITCNNPVLSWQGGGGAPTGYDVYFSTNATDVNNSAPAALVSSNQAGLTYNPGVLASNATYYWKVVPRNVDGPATGCSTNSFTTGSLSNCYCIPTYTGTICAGGISQVDFNTISNSAVCVAPAHAIYPATGSLTTTVQQNGTYNLSVTTDSADIISVWIDYNQNGTFDATEWTQVTTASVAHVASTIPITIPATALTGNTLMRVRSRFINNVNGATEPCINFGSGSSQDYVITIITPQPCSGTPNPGNTIASATSVCPGATVNLSLQNPTQGTGVTYQWNNNGGPITGATNSTYTATITAADDFYCDVNCGGNIGSSNLISIALNNFYSCYCSSVASSAIDEEIYNVTINGGSTNPLYANANGCSTVAPGPGSILNRYSNFTTLPAITTVTQGDIVPFTIAEDECDGATYFSNAVAIWIDFNHNGSFADAGEQVFVENALTVSPRTISGNITIPYSASTGLTAMRIICAENISGTSLTPCLAYTYGETEDHLINILVAPPCAGTPNPGNTIASASSACLNTTVNLSLQNAAIGTGITYQWYNGSGPITGATNQTYTATITAADNFHCDVTCSSSTGSSTPVAISITPYTNCYCAAGATTIGCTTGDEYIGNVTFNTINNTSTCPVSGQYTDFTSLSTTINAGQSYTASVLIPNWFTGDQAAVWIDFNHDGSLSDATERFLLTTGGTSGTDPFTGSISIPSNALSGATRMRVRGNYTGTMSSCGIVNFGEVEDYIVVIVPGNSTVNLKCFIEGYWDGSSGMLPVLANQGQTSSATACDSIDVELHDAASPYAMAYSVRTVLNQDGTAQCIFPALSSSYYIVVKHRSAIETWSANPVAISGTTNYDFTTAATQAYGTSLQQVEVSPGVWAFFSGDVETDQNMDLLDLGKVETDLSDFVFGYNYIFGNVNYPGVVVTDLNGDGNVDLLDSPILENNISQFIFSQHP